MSATIKDVANLAGVSTGTVSHYISGVCPVSLSKQKAIIDAMIALKYEVNSAARVLKSKRNNMIGLVLPNISDPYYIRILRGIETYTSDRSHLLTLSITNDDPTTEIKVITEMLHNQVSGLIIASCQPDGADFFAERILSRGIPVVFVERKVHGVDADFIKCDNYSGILELVNCVTKDGAKKIAFLCGNQSYTDQAEAFLGYTTGLKIAGIELKERLISTSAFDKESAFAEMLKILEHDIPDAVITVSGQLGYGVREALHLFGSQSGEGVKVCSLGVDTWDDYNGTDFFQTTHRRAIALGADAAEMLFKQLRNPHSSETSQRVVRDNTNVQIDKEKVEYVKDSNSIRLLLVPMTPSYALQQLLPTFERLSGIHVETEFLGHAHYYDELRDRMKRGNPPDVVLVDMPWMPLLASCGYLTDITQAIQERQIDTSIYVKNCMDQLCKFNGRTFGLPFEYAPQVLFYRNDLFSDQRLRNAYEQKTGSKLRPPRTWNEFNAVAQFFTRSYSTLSPTKYGASIPCKFAECMSAEIQTRMRAYGGEIFNKEGMVVFESKNNLNAFTKLIEAFQYCPPDIFSKDRNQSVQDFVSGDAAMIVNFHPILNEILSENVSHYLGVAPVPGFNAIMGGWCMSIPKNTSNFESAMRFITWASGRETSGKLMVLSSQSVVTDILDNDELVHRNRWFRTWRDAYQTAVPSQGYNQYRRDVIPVSDLDRILFQTVQKIVLEQMPIADALHLGQIKFSTLLETL